MKAFLRGTRALSALFIVLLGILFVAPQGAAMAGVLDNPGTGAAKTPCYEKISVVNSAAFVMNWTGKISTGLSTPSTDNYPVGQERTIDFNIYGIRDGVEIWPEVHAILGTTNSGPRVQFCEGGATAAYRVTGTTLNFSVNLL
ncbi:hypothetical protein [Kutzneria sp. CA-103260]|uniref:hypothetical protein n=1 Tax=Kutzneria sp. CA-103260 TaxID=2802641 RepID=UPI001BA614AB|nr:hypothetical protein [Kutzneria sp. CA-103260]QUQ71030.1 hypothetical protein JJ691_88130 [Kutzneria sp. CA-103260]